MAKRKIPLGVKDGKLPPCPSSPNCVSTQTESATHKIDPFSYQGTLADAKVKLMKAVASMKRTKLISNADNYLHYEFRTFTFRFVDDVEFFFDDEKKIIHFRSASRVGYGDLGVNRRRMETIRMKFVPIT